jgi:hypothetical protein
LNLKELKEKLLPTTHYFGRLNEQLKFTDTIISPDINRVTVEVTSLPFRIGVRQLDISSYPSRPFYTFNFNDYKIEDRVKGNMDNENDVNAVQMGVNAEKEKIRRKMPIKITIVRDKNEDIELLRIDGIEDCEGNPVPPNFFALQVQSISEPENFWLDSGIFSLNIQH